MLNPYRTPALTGSAWVEWRQLQQFLLRTSPSPSPPRKLSVLHESTGCSYRQVETPQGSHVSCTGGDLRKAVLLSAIVDPECTDERLSTHKRSFYPIAPLRTEVLYRLETSFPCRLSGIAARRSEWAIRPETEYRLHGGIPRTSMETDDSNTKR